MMQEQCSSNSHMSTPENLLSGYNFDTVKRLPFYFGSKDKPLLGWLHTTHEKEHSTTGVVICPPLAVEYMNSYRSLRYVADYFALAGIPALRFDYHGTGDASGIEEDDNRVKDWLWSINQAHKQLQTITGCSRTGLFGFRMGATLAALTAKEIPVDFLILWAALNSGRKYIREIRLIQATNKIQPQNDDPTLLEAGGMGYWPQTVSDINSINLTKLTPQAKHTLIIPRDEQISDTELFDAWQEKGLNVTQENDLGSTLMLVDAHLTVVPHKIIQKIVQWVQNKNTTETITNQIESNLEKYSSQVSFSHRKKSSNDSDSPNMDVTESILYYGSDKKNVAILTETEKSKNSSLPTVIIANSGANHRVGPSRLYVIIARELSLMGFRCIRIDVPGIGDSVVSNKETENIEYIDSSSNILLDAIKVLDSSLKRKNYIFMGLCSGAYFSFHASLDLRNINILESILINPLTFYWQQGMTVKTSPTINFEIWNWYKEALKTSDSWKKLIKGKVDFISLFTAIINRFKIKLGSPFKRIKPNTELNILDKHKYHLANDLIKIADNNIQIKFILARSDPGHDILMTNAGKTVNKLKNRKQLHITFIENADHTFSKYQPRRDVIDTLLQHFKNKLS